MEGYKHFSHTHNLKIHHIPEGGVITCSGCNSSSTTTVYACWQCNFFLHEQCFHATRSLQHPSHPSHPLTLIPFPTYPTNSFYCNSCNQIGTGFTYCCSNCEFDLHVQCAYSTSFSSFSSHLTPQTHIIPQQNHTPIFNPQYASVLHQAPSDQPIPSAPFLNYPPIFHPSHVHNYPSINENHERVQTFNSPQNFNNTQNYSQLAQPFPSNHIPSYPSTNVTLPSLNAPQISNIPTQNPPNKETVQKVNNVQNNPQPSHDTTQETAVTEGQNEKSDSSTGNQDLNFQVEMQRLQLEMEMANQLAQMIANMGQSINNLAG